LGIKHDPHSQLRQPGEYSENLVISYKVVTNTRGKFYLDTENIF